MSGMTTNNRSPTETLGDDGKEKVLAFARVINPPIGPAYKKCCCFAGFSPVYKTPQGG
uniref:Uncharacterized protein n=1 Tax=uncultured Elusimicrobia bacterium TaxID=699876 RepID=A0A650EMX9_9BACT|nr:hypothetical protein Elusimicrob1349_1410 [uncultured Elusimicrobia bacterium]